MKPIIFFIIISYLFLSRLGFADIVEKKTYSIPPETKNKNDLNIAILPFSGELTEERKYVKTLIKNHLGDNILLYKSIFFTPSLIEFKRTAFSSEKKIKNNFENKNINPIVEFDNGKFLTIKLIEDNRLDAIKKNINIESQDWNYYPGIDIIITGTIIQNTQNLKVNLKVFNYFVLKKFIIEKEGTFKNIDQLMKELSLEIIKSIISNYSFLNITSNEKNASIYVDNRFFGRTDKSGILLEAGSHKIVVSKEKFIAKTFELKIKEKASESIHVEFTPRDAFTKTSIKITSTPEKARVYLDSNFIGLTPIAKNDLNSGKYRLRVEKEGYITYFQTVELDNDKNKNKDITIILQKGDSKEYYFSRTSAYNNLFKCSFFGMAISSASYFYFSLKKNDENAKLRALSTSDSNYESKKSRIEKRKNNYVLYQQISLYSIGAMIISAGIFYYFDRAQDDIAIAVYMPQAGFPTNSLAMPGSSSINRISQVNQINSIGILVTKSF